MADKIYCDGIYVRSRETQYGEMLNVSIDLAKFNEFAKQHGKDGQLRLTIGKRRNASPSGVTHSVALDTYEPKRGAFDGARKAAGSPRPQPTGGPLDDTPPKPEDGVPF